MVSFVFKPSFELQHILLGVYLETKRVYGVTLIAPTGKITAINVGEREDFQ